MAARQTVPVRILGQEYRIRSDGDPESVRRAARLLEETMEKVRGRSSTVDSLDVAVLAALNLAHHLVRDGRGAQDAGIGAKRITALADLVASALGGAASP